MARAQILRVPSVTLMVQSEESPIDAFQWSVSRPTSKSAGETTPLSAIKQATILRLSNARMVARQPPDVAHARPKLIARLIPLYVIKKPMNAERVAQTANARATLATLILESACLLQRFCMCLL